MFNVIRTCSEPLLRRLGRCLRDTLRAFVRPDAPDRLQGLWRPVALQPVRVRIRHHMDRL